MSYFQSYQQTTSRSNTRRHKGFESLQEFLNPKLRPSIHINTVEKLINYKFRRLVELIDFLCIKWPSCTIYIPWSQSGWAFGIFKACEDVSTLLTTLTSQLEQHYSGNNAVKVIKNIYDNSKKQETDYDNSKKQETDYVEIIKHAKNTLFVFGDNTSGVGKGNAAAVRDYPNAYGIPTGWSDNYGQWTKQQESAFFRKNALIYEFEENREQLLIMNQQQLKQGQANLITHLNDADIIQQQLIEHKKQLDHREILLNRPLKHPKKK